jgi:membrane-associated protease RseP (regulator of RpoE activity)
VAWVNISWGVLNLLPILPLDGGNVLLLVLQAATHGAGERPARIVSMIGAGIGAILGVATGQIGSALLALWLASNNWRALAATGAPPR